MHGRSDGRSIRSSASASALTVTRHARPLVRPAFKAPTPAPPFLLPSFLSVAPPMHHPGLSKNPLDHAASPPRPRHGWMMDGSSF
ncbi:hypothetical protein GUJ93_ZPchr0006g42548 [Zizania palustris]|uniref:Uncharacterized protein n=1 Tax=Zizania palustris TaxID=103762 RepID=A0A8J5VUI1_ZIZPA|nr:hypothetical protein GUJ93_ZPchr0006g42548 [Zizania palustris]